ncbi:MAG: histidine--tRNA ligase [Clostridia bacterium]|nr:histidine--tRNA ligase [Clostridia bacterium]
MEKIRKPRGTMDIMTPDVYIWNHIEDTVRDVARRFGFGEIRTPTFEELGLFHRGVGETTDVVQKEMYTFEDKEGRVFALRPEGTASVVRAVLENGKCSDTMPLKLFYLISCFRYEKPQAGRSREFYQFGTEMFGAADPSADFTVIALADTIIKELGIKDVALHINSIGCPHCRPAYRARLISYFEENEDKLCETCRQRLHTNPLRVLDCKNETCAKLAAEAPTTVDNLCPECADHMTALRRYLDAAGIAYTVDPHIVRGLDYYTRTVFEFIAGGIGAQSTVCGGGRYDGLMEQLGGPSMPGIGFGMGLTRLILAMEQSGVTPPAAPRPEVYLAPMGDAAKAVALTVTQNLRAKGIYAECDIMSRSLKAQMKYADKIGARRTLILGDSEIESGKAQLRNMENGTQKEISLTDAAEILLGEINA